MNDVYVLTQELELIGVIDTYESLIWRPAYYDIGDFELYLPASTEVVKLLQKNYYLVRSSDITVVDGVTTYKNVMIIKGLKLTTSVESGDYLSVTGKELKYLLHQRIVWTQTNLSGTVENAIRSLVTVNAISPADTSRVIPTLQLTTAVGYTDTISKQVTGAHLDVAITDICKAYNYGWEVYVTGGKLTFNLYRGIDRSYSQTERPYVVFSGDFDNLYSTTYELDALSYANTCLIAGEGEGLSRATTTVNNSNAGLDRYELYVDARDLSRNLDTENEISLTDYLTLLQERGTEAMAEVSVTEGFSGELLDNVSFKYGSDYGLGDRVTVINEYGITKDTQVLSLVESEDSNGRTLVPQFNL